MGIGTPIGPPPGGLVVVDPLPSLIVDPLPSPPVVGFVSDYVSVSDSPNNNFLTLSFILSVTFSKFCISV